MNFQNMRLNLNKNTTHSGTTHFVVENTSALSAGKDATRAAGGGVTPIVLTDETQQGTKSDQMTPTIIAIGAVILIWMMLK